MNNNTTNNSNFEIDINIGGFPFILKFLSIYIPYSLLSFLGFLIGLIGNSLIASAIFANKELRQNSTCILILNLAVADLSISIIVNSFTVVGTLVGKNFFDSNPGLCEFIGATCLISCGTSLVTMGFLALNRYICIFYFKKYDRIFSAKRTYVYCALTWLMGMIFDLPNFLGIGSHVFDKKTLSCVFDRLKIGYTITFSVTCIILPCLSIGYCYLKIFLHAFKIRAKVSDKNIKQNGTLEAVKIAKSLFASFFLFSACWIPVAIIFIIDIEDKLPISAHTFTNLSAHLNSALNPVLYALFNPKIRDGYLKVFNILTCSKFKYIKRRSNDLPTTFTIAKTY